jgi:LPXTG-motif cell wall-anchored protein
MANDPPRVPGHRGPVTGLATGAKAALITTFVLGMSSSASFIREAYTSQYTNILLLGGIALIVGAIWYFRRRRLLAEREKRHADDAFNPGNVGSLTLPETTHVTAGSDTSPNSLFESPQYISRKPVGSGQSTSRSASRTHHFFPSRIATPEPTPNPFADAPRNKAYDQLRGRPRSTTLTDRGSWVENPFKDPASDRFDPFGELQRKAKDERRKYVEELRKEAEKKRRLMERGDDQKEMK